MLSDRLKKKVQQSCCKNILPLVIVDWLLNGSVKDKEDVYSILKHIEHTTEILNGIYGQIHNKVDPTQVKDDIYKDLKKILSHEDKYGRLDTKNRVYVETRGWIIPILSLCSKNHNDECIQILNNYMNPIVDNTTRFWAFYSYILNLDLEFDKVKNKINEIKQQYQYDTKYDELYWFCHIWNINNNNDSESESKEKLINLLNNFYIN